MAAGHLVPILLAGLEVVGSKVWDLPALVSQGTKTWVGDQGRVCAKAAIGVPGSAVVFEAVGVASLDVKPPLASAVAEVRYSVGFWRAVGDRAPPDLFRTTAKSLARLCVACPAHQRIVVCLLAGDIHVEETCGFVFHS